jgi:hypothetical protein
MSEYPSQVQLNLDPWVASSLLQKSIRRGEAKLAQRAVALLYRYRGAAVWWRLITIAIEDVGIADLDLVCEIIRLGTDKPLRAVLGSDPDLMHEFAAKLAAAPKDRSADYLNSVVMWELSCGQDLFRKGADRDLNVRASVQPLVSEATQVLLQCTTIDRAGRTINGPAVRQLLYEGRHAGNADLEDCLRRLAGSRVDAFALMLLPLWSAFSEAAERSTVSVQAVPEAQWVSGIPLHVLDKHTAAGKVAISRFAGENSDMRQALCRWVAPPKRVDVALIAAFYVDAMPVSRRLEWSQSEAIYELGLLADMLMARCPEEAVPELLECVRDNLDHLNDLRRCALLGRPATHQP